MAPKSLLKTRGEAGAGAQPPVVRHYSQFATVAADVYSPWEEPEEFSRCFISDETSVWDMAEATWALLPPYSFESPDRMARAASALVARCQQLYEMGYLVNLHRNGKLVLDGLLTVLAANQLHHKLAAGMNPQLALDNILRAMEALYRIGGAQDASPDCARLRGPALRVAAFIAEAWGQYQQEELPQGLPMLWEEHGLLRQMGGALQAAVKRDLEAGGFAQEAGPKATVMLQSLCFRVATQLIKCRSERVQLMAWTHLLPALLSSCSLLGTCTRASLSSKASIKVCDNLVKAVGMFNNATTDSTIAASDSPLLSPLDRADVVAGLLTGLQGLVRIVITAPPKTSEPSSAPVAGGHQQVVAAEDGGSKGGAGAGAGAGAGDEGAKAAGEQGGAAGAAAAAVSGAAWGNDMQGWVRVLASSLEFLVAKQGYQGRAFLEAGGIALELEFLEFFASSPVAHCRDRWLPLHCSTLAMLAGECMRHVDAGKDMQAAFGVRGLELCLQAMEGMPAPSQVAAPFYYTDWQTSKALLRLMEAACSIGSNVNGDHCLFFLEDDREQDPILQVVEIIRQAMTPPPPSEAIMRRDPTAYTRVASLLRNGASLLATLIRAADTGHEQLDLDYQESVCLNISLKFKPSELVTLLQWGTVVQVIQDEDDMSLNAFVESNESLLGAVLCMLAGTLAYEERHSKALAQSQAGLSTFYKAGLATVKDLARIPYRSMRHWVHALDVLLEYEPVEEELLELGVFDVVGIAAGFTPRTMAAVLEMLYRTPSTQGSITAVLSDAMKEPYRELLHAINKLLRLLLQDNSDVSARCCDQLMLGAVSLLDPEEVKVWQAWEWTELNSMLELLRRAQGRAQELHKKERLEFDRKAHEAEAAAAALLAEEEAQSQQAQAAQSKKVAKKQKQKQRKKEAAAAAAAEQEAAEAAAAAAKEAERQRQREVEQRRRELQRQQQQGVQQQRQQQQQQEDADAEPQAGKKKKKKKNKASAAAAATLEAASAATPEAAAAVSAAAALAAVAVESASASETLFDDRQEPSEAAAGAAAAVADDPSARLAEMLAAIDAGQAGGQEHEAELEALLQQLLPGADPSGDAGGGNASSSSTAALAAGYAMPLPHQQSEQQPLQQQCQPTQQQQQQWQEEEEEELELWPQHPAALRAVLQCPLTGRMMRDPVIMADGHSYERSAAFAWLAGSTCSPLTGEPLGSSSLWPNHALRQLLEDGI